MLASNHVMQIIQCKTLVVFTDYPANVKVLQWIFHIVNKVFLVLKWQTLLAVQVLVQAC